MRLFNPAGSAMPMGSRVKKIITILIVVMALAVALLVYRHHKDKNPLATPNLDATELQIQTFKNSSNVDDMRVVVSAYENKNDYKDALPLAQKVADKTKTYQDYMAVLDICTRQSVPDKSGCINDTVNKLKPLLSKMPFSSAYAAGVLLERSGNGKLAVDFYQRAYAVYAPDPKAENMMSKDQLKAKVDELRK
jgi:hypothetical protein